jgi:hypothetical protein
MNFIKESTYWHGAGKIADSLNRLLHEILGCAAAAIILTVFFCKVSPLLEELPQVNNAMFYNRTKIC